MRPDEILVIGAGPAGITAAIQLKRYDIPFTLVEQERVGGLLWNANLVENYPGFPKGISGPKLVGLIKKQMERIGVQVTTDTVIRITHDNEAFHVRTRLREYHPRFVLVASGTRSNPIRLAIPPASQDRVFSEVYPLLHARGKRVVIVGAGDAAFDYALNLTKNRNSVTILNRGKTVKCLRLLWQRAMADPSITYRAETPIRGVSLKAQADQLEVELESGEILKADFLLFAIGRVPQTEFLPAELLEGHTKGLFFIGDVKNGPFRQAVIAAGDGLHAAMEIHFKLEAERLSNEDKSSDRQT